MKFSGRQVAAARELLGLGQSDLATLVGVARRTITRFENGEAEIKPATLSQIQAELERRGIEFTNGNGIGIRLNYEKAAEFARTSSQARTDADR
jgi:transcriptional regulator with XRE-family HTH domain